jgi:hypothetical protein
MSITYNSTPKAIQVVGTGSQGGVASVVIVFVTKLPLGYAVVWRPIVVAYTVEGT